MMGTEILKIDAEMAEKIEVEVGNPHLKTDRKAHRQVSDMCRGWVRF